MADTGRRMTDAEFRRLRAKIKGVYQEAYEDIYKKNLDFVKRHERREAQYRQMMDEGRITKTDFDMWMRGQVFQGKQWEAKRKQMEATLLNADQMAMDMINGSRVRVFADNANFIGYELEQHGRVDTSFGLYDINSVKRLLMEEPDLLPPRSVGKDESYKWYNKQIQGAVTQGIIQGEKLTDIAKRIGQVTGERCMNAMLRNARTMHTGAENAGRIEGMHQAQRLGIEVQKKWLATLDGHTRDSHRTLDGQVRDVDKPFDSEFGKIRFPGDATAYPGDVWNCRCTLTYVYPKYPDSMVQRRDNITGEVIEDITYREWEAMKAKIARVEQKKQDNSDIVRLMKQHPIFAGIDEETRDVIVGDIINGDRQFAERAYRCMDNASVSWHGEKSRYTGYGRIEMADKDRDEIGRVFWHEYGHFIDDANASGSNIFADMTYTTRKGVEKHETIIGARWIADYDKKYEKAVDTDLNAFFARHNLDFESRDGGWIYRQDGTLIDPRKELFGIDAQKIQDALSSDWKLFTGRTKAEEYLYEQGYPREVSIEDYGKYYQTPIRKTRKFKWNSRTAQQEYADAMKNYYDRVDEFRSRTDMDKINAEIDRLTTLAEANEKNCGGVTDTFDGMMFGFGGAITTMGGHRVEYYMRDSDTRIGEGVANIHEQTIRGNTAAEAMYKELCPNVYSLIKGALSYGL